MTSRDNAVPRPSPPAHAPSLLDAAGLVAAGRLVEAEAELEALAGRSPGDAETLRLLALVRAKLGRAAEARAAFGAALQSSSSEPHVLVDAAAAAIRAGAWSEAAALLTQATAAAGDDARAWRYLGYVQLRLGQTAEAATAFRRGGDERLAGALLASGSPPPEPKPQAVSPVAAAVPEVEGFGPPGSRAATLVGTRPAAVAPTPLTEFVLARLLAPAADGAPRPSCARVRANVLRLAIEDGVVARAPHIVATSGALTATPVGLRTRGGVVAPRPGDPGSDWVQLARTAGTTRGEGDEPDEVLLRGREGLEALTLSEDVLYVRSEAVLGFRGALAWEVGRVPRTSMTLLQLRGSGLVAIEWPAARELVAVSLRGPQPLLTAPECLLGWVGAIVALPLAADDPRHGSPAALVACEGEGVVLLSPHGLDRQAVEKRA